MQKVGKMSVYFFLIFYLVIFAVGIMTIIKSEEKSISLVTNTIEEEDVFVAEGQTGKSIELYSKEYKRRGAVLLVLSSVGLVQTLRGIFKKRKINLSR